jgi:hypothetical protein
MHHPYECLEQDEWTTLETVSPYELLKQHCRLFLCGDTHPGLLKEKSYNSPCHRLVASTLYKPHSRNNGFNLIRIQRNQFQVQHWKGNPTSVLSYWELGHEDTKIFGFDDAILEFLGQGGTAASFREQIKCKRANTPRALSNLVRTSPADSAQTFEEPRIRIEDARSKSAKVQGPDETTGNRETSSKAMSVVRTTLEGGYWTPESDSALDRCLAEINAALRINDTEAAVHAAQEMESLTKAQIPMPKRQEIADLLARVYQDHGRRCSGDERRLWTEKAYRIILQGPEHE